MASFSMVSTVASCASPTNASVVPTGALRRFAAAAASASACAFSCSQSFASTETPLSRPAFTAAAGEFTAGTAGSGTSAALELMFRSSVTAIIAPPLLATH